MFRKIAFFGLVASVFAAPAFADWASREESAGVGTGAVIGGALGGPPGVIVGAAIGGALGDRFHQKKEAVETLSASLNDTRSSVDALQREVNSLNSEILAMDNELIEARDMAKPEVLALLQAGIEMDLLFRTDEDVLSQNTGARLGQLATAVAGNPDIQIRLDGFADERGDETYNQELSARRVEHVRDLLVSNGIPTANISVTAHGESPALDATADSYALERRVSLTLYMGETPSFASNPR